MDRNFGAMKINCCFPLPCHLNSQRGWMRNQFAAHKDDAVWEMRSKHNMMSQLNPGSDLRDFMEASVTVIDEGGGMISMEFPSINPVQGYEGPTTNNESKREDDADQLFFCGSTCTASVTNGNLAV